jgi:hypothetical protein
MLTAPTAVYWRPWLLWQFRLVDCSLVTTTNLRYVKSPKCEFLNITEVSTPTSDVSQYVLCTGSQLSLKAGPLPVASYLQSSLHRTLIFVRPLLPPQLRPLQMKTDLHCPPKPRTNINSRSFPRHSATPSLARFSHHNRTNELATSRRFTSVSPPVFSPFQHYLLIGYQF